MAIALHLTRATMLASLAATSIASGQIFTSAGTFLPELLLETSYDTRVRGSGLSGEGSWIHVVQPTIGWRREQGVITATALAGVRWETFSDAPDLDAVNPFASLGFRHDSDLYRSTLDFSFSESSSQDELRVGRFRSRNYGGEFRIRRIMRRPWGLGFEAGWSREQELPGGAEQDTLNAGPRVTYTLGRNLDLYADYQLRETRTTDALGNRTTTDTSGAGAGIDGRLPIRILPGLTLTATAAWQVRSGDGVTKRAGLVGDAGASFDLSPLTTLTLSGSRNFVTSLDSDQGVQTRIEASVLHRFAPRLRGRAGVGWAETSFDGGPSAGESQEQVFARVRLEYELVQHAQFYAGFELTDQTSDTANRAFVRQLYTLGVRLIY